MALGERSFSEVFQDIVRNVQDIVRSEVRLAKTEVREEIGKARTAGVLVGGGAVSGLFATLFLLLTAFFLLSRVMPDWSAALLLAVVLAAITGVTLSLGIKRFKQVHPAPERTIETVKEDAEWAKQQMK